MVPFAKNVREWFAFYGGEELGISLEHASIVWNAAIKSVKLSVCPYCDTPAVTIIRESQPVCSVCGHAWDGR